MKLRNIIACATIACTALSSCNKDVERAVYEAENQGVTFLVEASDVNLTPSDTQGTIQIARSTTDGEATVRVTAYTSDGNGDLVAEELPENISVPSVVTFADGEGTADVVINVGDVELGETKTITIEIADKDQLSEFDPKDKIVVNIMKNYNFNLIGEGTYSTIIWAEGDDYEDIPVEIYQAQENPNVYKVLNFLGTGYDFVFTLTEDGQGMEEATSLTPTGIKGSYGMYYHLPVSFRREGNKLYFGIMVYVNYMGNWYDMLDEPMEEIVVLP
jgi:hypothetical protein